MAANTLFYTLKSHTGNYFQVTNSEGTLRCEVNHFHGPTQLFSLVQVGNGETAIRSRHSNLFLRVKDNGEVQCDSNKVDEKTRFKFQKSNIVEKTYLASSFTGKVMQCDWGGKPQCINHNFLLWEQWDVIQVDVQSLCSLHKQYNSPVALKSHTGKFLQLKNFKDGTLRCNTNRLEGQAQLFKRSLDDQGRASINSLQNDRFLTVKSNGDLKCDSSEDKENHSRFKILYSSNKIKVYFVSCASQRVLQCDLSGKPQCVNNNYLLWEEWEIIHYLFGSPVALKSHTGNFCKSPI